MKAICCYCGHIVNVEPPQLVTCPKCKHEYRVFSTRNNPSPINLTDEARQFFTTRKKTA